MERALMEYLLTALWQVPVLAGGAWLLVRLVRMSPRVEHALWLAVLGMAIVLPTLGMAGRFTPRVHVSSATRERMERVPLAAASAQPRGRQPYTVRIGKPYVQWLVRLYAATVMLGLLRMLLAYGRARQLVAHAQATVCHQAAMEYYSQRFGLPCPQVRKSAAVSSPTVVGAWAPVLLLPEGFDRSTEQEICAALCHELAHIKRHDYFKNLLCRLVSLPLAWHPLMGQVHRRISMTREMICDAIAAEQMESRIGYARCLLALAQRMLAHRGAFGAANALNLFGNHTLEERMKRLTESTSKSVRGKVTRLALGAVTMIATGLVATEVHVMPMLAQDAAGPHPVQPLPVAPSAAPVARSARDQAPIAGQKRAHPRPPTSSHQNLESAAKLKEMLESPEFKRQIEQAQQQAASVKKLLDSPEFKKQIEQAQQQAASFKKMLDSPEFKRQIEEAQRQASMATEMLNSPEFKRQMEGLRKAGSWAEPHKTDLPGDADTHEATP